MNRFVEDSKGKQVHGCSWFTKKRHHVETEQISYGEEQKSLHVKA